MKRTLTLQCTREEMQEYAEFFRNMRASIGIQQKQMAALLGIHPSTLRRWEKGRVIPHQSLDDLEQLFKGIIKTYRK